MTELRTIIHPRLGEVTLARSPRVRRVTLSVRPSGTERLAYPSRFAQARALAFRQTKSQCVHAARERMSRRQPALPPELSAEERTARIEELRRAAREDLPPRIERWSQLTGLRYAKLTIRASRSKWGSCTGQNHISLSLFLMTLPEHLRDFVILHELCHTVHHDHSARFHALLDRLVGGHEKALNRELRAYTTGR